MTDRPICQPYLLLSLLSKWLLALLAASLMVNWTSEQQFNHSCMYWSVHFETPCMAAETVVCVKVSLHNCDCCSV